MTTGLFHDFVPQVEESEDSILAVSGGFGARLMETHVKSVIAGDPLLENSFAACPLQGDDRALWLKRILTPPIDKGLFTRYPIPPAAQEDILAWASEHLIVFPQTADDELNTLADNRIRSQFGTWEEYAEPAEPAGVPCCEPCANKHED